MTISTVYLLVKEIDFKFNLKNGQKYINFVRNAIFQLAKCSFKNVYKKICNSIISRII